MKKINKIDVLSILVAIAAGITVVYAFYRLYQYRYTDTPTPQIMVVEQTATPTTKHGHYTGYVKGADGQQHWYDGDLDIDFNITNPVDVETVQKQLTESVNNIKPVENPLS